MSAARGRQVEGAASRLAWYLVLLIPALVPIASSKIPFIGSPLTYNLYVYPKIFVLSLLVFGASIAWGVGVVSGRIKPRTVPLVWWFVSLLGLATLSTVFGLSPSTSFFGNQYNSVGLSVLLLAAMACFLVIQLATSASRVQALAWSAVVGGCVVSLIGLLQVVGLDPMGSIGEGFMTARGASLLGNPDYTGTYLVVALTLSFALALSEQTPRVRAFAAGATFLTLTATALTLTRGAWVGAAVGVAILAVVAWRWEVRPSKGATISLLAGLVAALILVLREPTRAIRQIEGVVSTGAGGRVMLWTEALKVVARHPLLGTGPDAYTLGWYGVRGAASMGETGITAVTYDPHNIPLLFAATMGVPGGIAVVGLVFASLYTSAASVWARSGNVGRIPFAGWWGATIALSVALLVSTNTVTATAMMAVCIGVLAAPRSRETEWAAAARWACPSVIALLSALLLIVATATVVSDAQVMAAHNAVNRVDVLYTAVGTAPWNLQARAFADEALVERVRSEAQASSPQTASDATLAERKLRETIASYPRDYEGYAKLARLLVNASSAEGTRAAQAAVVASDQALRIYPVSPEAAYLKALAQFALDQPTQAVATLQPLWEIDPGYAQSQTAYVEALRRAGDTVKAVAVLEVVRSRFPDDPTVEALEQELSAPGSK